MEDTNAMVSMSTTTSEVQQPDGSKSVTTRTEHRRPDGSIVVTTSTETLPPGVETTTVPMMTNNAQVFQQEQQYSTTTAPLGGTNMMDRKGEDVEVKPKSCAECVRSHKFFLGALALLLLAGIVVAIVLPLTIKGSDDKYSSIRTPSAVLR